MTFEEAHFEATEKDEWSDADNRYKGNSEGDILAEVADALGKIREVAQGSRDRMLLYFIDMAIFQACDCLCSDLRGTGRKSSELKMRQGPRC